MSPERGRPPRIGQVSDRGSLPALLDEGLHELLGVLLEDLVDLIEDRVNVCVEVGRFPRRELDLLDLVGPRSLDPSLFTLRAHALTLICPVPPCALLAQATPLGVAQCLEQVLRRDRSLQQVAYMLTGAPRWLEGRNALEGVLSIHVEDH
jgi:hypothetical protein